VVPFRVGYYVDDAGRDVFLDWLKTLRDPVARTAIDRRVNRVALGNFGDHAPCRDGVWEMRIHVGAGYRVYYAISGEAVVLLLGGGDKQSQHADISRACARWLNERRRQHHAK
jgi:putative addiction module killer protein